VVSNIASRSKSAKNVDIIGYAKTIGRSLKKLVNVYNMVANNEYIIEILSLERKIEEIVLPKQTKLLLLLKMKNDTYLFSEDYVVADKTAIYKSYDGIRSTPVYILALLSGGKELHRHYIPFSDISDALFVILNSNVLKYIGSKTNIPEFKKVVFDALALREKVLKLHVPEEEVPLKDQSDIFDIPSTMKIKDIGRVLKDLTVDVAIEDVDDKEVVKYFFTATLDTYLGKIAYGILGFSDKKFLESFAKILYAFNGIEDVKNLVETANQLNMLVRRAVLLIKTFYKLNLS